MSNGNNSRERILKTASRLFQTNGYNGTGLNEIIKDSGSPKGSLYYYFPNGKEELALEALKLTGDTIKEKIRKDLNDEDDPAQVIQTMLDTIIMDLERDSSFQEISLSLMALETYQSSELLREACKKIFLDLEGIYCELLMRHGYSIESSQELAMVIETMIEGAFTIAVTKRDVAPFKAISKHIGALLKVKE